MLDLRRDGDVFVLQLDRGENRFSPDLLPELGRALDEVEKVGNPAALVFTGSGKFFSNGLDVDYMTGGGGGDVGGYVGRVLGVLARVLTFPAVTVAAVNGHAFGAGAQLALVCDHAVMREDRGYFCMPEIDMRAPLHPGMTALVKARMPNRSAHESIVTGRRYGGADAVTAGIVDESAAEAAVLPRAIEIATPLAAKAHPVMQTLKRDLHAHVLEAMALPLGAIQS